MSVATAPDPSFKGQQATMPLVKDVEASTAGKAGFGILEVQARGKPIVGVRTVTFECEHVHLADARAQGRDRPPGPLDSAEPCHQATAGPVLYQDERELLSRGGIGQSKRRRRRMSQGERIPVMGRKVERACR